MLIAFAYVDSNVYSPTECLGILNPYPLFVFCMIPVDRFVYVNDPYSKHQHHNDFKAISLQTNNVMSLAFYHSAKYVIN